MDNHQTQRYVAQTSGASLVILENDRVRVCNLDERNEWSVGRYAPNMPNTPNVMFTSPIVSREHGWLRNIDDQWYYVDNPRNLNGTFLNGVKIPKPYGEVKRPTALESGDVLRIDSDDLEHVHAKGVFMLFTTVPVRGTWTIFPLKPTTVIGREPGCDLVEPMDYISAQHAKITGVGGQYYITDCGSRAGTFLNGKRVESTTRLREKDLIGICDCTFIFLGDKLLYPHRDRARERRELQHTMPGERPVILKANIKSKKVPNNSGSGMKELLRDIRVDVREGTLVALLGGAGAGKSTFMNCLNGMDLAGVTGSVYCRNVDMMKNFEQMEHLIGSVPQKKTFHPTFTPEQEFEFAAIKRLPGKTSKKEIRARVDNTLNVLGIDKVRKSKNSKLSGGEQTRVNIGIELVADREILFLDEPDQGLDPENRANIFRVLRDLAHSSGKTVLAIFHNLDSIDLFDQVVMLVKSGGTGRVAFNGTPDEMRKYFGVEELNSVYGLLASDPDKYVK